MANDCCMMMFYGSQAPFLKQYFEAMVEYSTVASDKDVLQLMLNPVTRKEVEDKKKKLRGKMFTLAAKSFMRHDKNGDGVLSVDESKVFFEDYVAAFKSFAKPLNEKLGAIVMTKVRGVATQEEVDATAKEIEKNKATAVEQAEAKLQKYLDNEEEYNKKAFAVVDKDGSGQLEMNEVCTALLPDSHTNVDLLVALGLLPEEQAPMFKGLQGGEEQCVVQ
mmetsp:Transcript_46007/g.73439  ORF Transcript_46007/g.73439 Transcript_46007/m.73439 type:complete len:220 (-) Transcript_46007:91-750(-)